MSEPTPRGFEGRLAIALTLAHLLLSGGCTVWMIEDGDKIDRMYAMAFGVRYVLFAALVFAITVVSIWWLRRSEGK
jgi:hypothetical protein